MLALVRAFTNHSDRLTITNVDLQVGKHNKELFENAPPLHGYSRTVQKSTTDIPYKGTAGPSENTLLSLEKYFIQLRQIQYTGKSNAISSDNKYNIQLRKMQYNF